MTSTNFSPNEPITVENLLKLANTIDLFEQYARPHASQMARLAEVLALRVGISGMDLNALKIAALLHDIGEMIMDSSALRKGGQIDFKNKIELWRHPIIGEQQLSKRDLPKQAQLIVRWHHEKWNGAGYPDMLSKEKIPLGARILRLVDTYDALTANRPHREAFSSLEAQEIIEKLAGIEFDPYLVKIFLEMLCESSPQASTSKPTNEHLEIPTEFLEPQNITKGEQLTLSNHESNPLLTNSEVDTNQPDKNHQYTEPVLPDLSNLGSINSNSADLFNKNETALTNLTSPTSMSETFSELDQKLGLEEKFQPQGNLETQPLFLPSNELTRELLNTSHLSTPNQPQLYQNDNEENILVENRESTDEENVEN